MKAYLYKSEYTVENNKPVIHLFGRYEDKTKFYKVDRNFQPYFYASEHSSIPDDPRIINIQEGYTNLFGNKVKKITVRLPKDVTYLREVIPETWENDILFNLRYIIDNVDTIFKEKNIEWIGGFKDWRLCCIDIETTTAQGFPNPQYALNQITSITIYDSYNKKYYCFVWRDDLETGKRVEKDKEIFTYNNEIDMLKKFCMKFAELSPDIITGWNIEGFDLPYLINRLSKLRIQEKYLLSPISKVYVREGGFSEVKYLDAVIGGVGVIDAIKVYRQTHKGELRSFSLRNVALDELGIDKGFVNAEDEWKKSDINELVNYNCQDVELVIKLNEKRKLINFVNGICDVAKCNFEDVKFYSRVSDMLCLRYAKRHNIVLPSKRELNKDREKFEGALVIANPGLYENVISLDFTSLYPNIVKSFNMSLETIDDNGDIDCLKMKTSSKKVGIIPSVVDELINLRKVYKEKQMNCDFGSDEYYVWDAIQQAAKNLYCVLGYGVNALSSFRLYDQRIGESITAIGRELLSQTVKMVEKEGHKVVQGDTDSTYIQFNEKFQSLDDIIKEAERLLVLLNKEYNKWCKAKGVINPTIDIKFEKIYKRFLTGSKKRWAGYLLWREGKIDEGIDIAGFNVRRSDSSNFTRKFQKEVLEKLLKGAPKEEIQKYIYDEYQKLINFKYDYETIGIPTKLNKPVEEYKTNLPVCRGSKWSNEHLNTMFKVGDKFLMLWCCNIPDVICFEYNEQLKSIDINNMLDMDRMVKRSIEMPLKTIFEAIGWDSNNIIKKNRTLDEF